MSPPPPPASPVSAPSTALYRRSLLKAADLGGVMVRGLIADALAQAERAPPRPVLDEAVQALRHHASLLGDAYPATLLGMLDTTEREIAKGLLPMGFEARSGWRLPIDDRISDDQRTIWRLAWAEAERQAQAPAAVQSLAELDAAMSRVLGYAHTLSSANPVQPASLVIALVKVGAATRTPLPQRLIWLQLMTPTLGPRIADLLGGLAQRLNKALNTLRDDPPSHSGGLGLPDSVSSGLSHNASVGSAEANEDDEEAEATQKAYLQSSVKALRRLLDGELHDWNPTVKSHVVPAASRGHARAPTPGLDAPPTAFAYTVPAALELLSNPAHVGTVIERLAGRGHPVGRGGFSATVPVGLGSMETGQQASAPAAESPFFNSSLLDPAELLELSPDQLRDVLREHARSPGQLLGLEVVSMLIENLCTELGLLRPVQRVLQALERPLMRLVMADPRFFSDAQHPARQLLSAIAAQGSQHTDENDASFKAFLQPMQEMVTDLQTVPMYGPEPFAVTLQALQGIWAEQAEADDAQREAAQRALLQAERRNQLAATVADLIKAREDIVGVPAEVVHFATTAWAQVIALAQLQHDGVHSRMPVSGFEPSRPPSFLPSLPPEADAPQHWQDVLTDLFWSVHLDAARSDSKRLVRLIPTLLSRIRAGLKTIQYPASATNQFLELLMVWHQKALMSAASDAPAHPAGQSGAMLESVLPTGQAPRPGPVLYLAPDEAKAIGFIDSQVFSESTTAAEPEPSGDPLLMPLPPGASSAHLSLGDWVDVSTDRHHLRGQLVWASAEGTLFMFATGNGRNQSLTRHTLDKLIAQGRVRLVRFDRLFEHAVDAVMQNVLGKGSSSRD